MTDRYQTFTRTPLGQTLVKNLGLPDPMPLQRWIEGSPVIDGPVVFGAIGETDAGKAIQALLRDEGVAAGQRLMVTRRRWTTLPERTSSVALNRVTLVRRARALLRPARRVPAPCRVFLPPLALCTEKVM